eukprot:TRINITY_DN16613_c1_g1_i2.p1 TRINITY_DN16613_c1_g1~~TRINITY_DN16613_c1_g1_i2.p1  ORF type:complete len:336 (+),score=68.27 TRINITY_DN16613_c1_g1_i2:118-1008(+)
MSVFVEDEDAPRELIDRHGRVWHRSERSLGRGANGEVWLGMSDGGMLVAIKTIKLPDAPSSPASSTPSSPVSPCAMIPRRTFSRRRGSVDETMRKIDELVNEVNILKNVHHENIVNYHACVVTTNYAVVCMEYVAGGTLQSMLEDFRTLPETAIQKYIVDILSGLRCLHSHGFLHRDLKPANLLITPNGRCKLADFGAARSLAQECSDTLSTPVYMAPEACCGSFSCASDIWSLGIVMCQLYTGNLPYDFAEMDAEAMRQNIIKSVNFLVSLLKKNWQNIKSVYIKSTFGPPQRIY